MEPIKIIEVKSEIAAGTRGASLGIDAIKTACLDKGSNYFLRHKQEVLETLNDILFQEDKHPHAKFIEGVYTMVKRVSKAIYSAYEEQFFPIVLAGDHSTSAGTIAGIKSAFPDKRLGVIWIDAHADIHSPFTTPSGNMHGMPLAMALNEDNLTYKKNEVEEDTLLYWGKIKNIGIKGPKLKHKDLVYIGIRDFEPEEEYLITKHQIKTFKTEDLRTMGIEKVTKETLNALSSCDLIYISFDVDSIDPAISEGTGTPVENGFTVEEALQLTTLLARDPRVCCWEMVEVNPTLDSLNLMAENAFDILEAVTDALINSRVRIV